MRLVRIALRHWHSDRCWHAITRMQMRGSSETLAMVHRLAASPSWRRRSLGLYIASQLRQRRTHSSVEFGLAATQELLLAGLQDQKDEVVCAAVSGLGHRPHPAALTRLVGLATHPNASIRCNVAISLGRDSEQSAVDALLRLASDTDDRVRDWATFGLGTLQQHADTPEIREALWKNLHDRDEEVRGEALVGLAERRDPRAINHLIEHLDLGCRVYELEAAAKLASPLLLGPLQNIADGLSKSEAGGYWFDHLQAALIACGRSA